jgi:hypothetical protein
MQAGAADHTRLYHTPLQARRQTDCYCCPQSKQSKQAALRQAVMLARAAQPRCSAHWSEAGTVDSKKPAWNPVC